MPSCSICRTRSCWLCLLFVFALIFSTALPAEKRANDIPMLTQFDIGRRTYFDFGPPNDYYELFLVRSQSNATAVERVTLTPYATCLAPAKMEIAHATLTEPVAALVENTNPCGIPEKDLRRQRKQCKHCLNWSGAEVVIRVPCGTGTRLIRADILERDWFLANAHTPKRTSWAMALLQKLEQALGPGVMEKPAFDIPNDGGAPHPATPAPHLARLEDLAAGNYDALFSGPDKVSDLYHAAQNSPPPPKVELVSSTPYWPDSFAMPSYPLVRRFDALVSFTAQIDESGAPVRAVDYIPGHEPQADLTLKNGAPYLHPAIRAAVAKWHFPKEAAGQQVHVELRFTSNCPKKTE